MLKMLSNTIAVNNIQYIPVLWDISLLGIHMFRASHSQTVSHKLLLLLDFGVENILRMHEAQKTHVGAISEIWPPQPHYQVFKEGGADSILSTVLYLHCLFLSSRLIRNKISDKPDFAKESLEEI